MTVVPVGNPHQTQRRMEKAIALADVLAAVCEETRADSGDDFACSEVVADLDDKTWRLAAKRAGVNKPSAKTRGLVVMLLEDREQARAGPRFEHPADSLEGLPRP